VAESEDDERRGDEPLLDWEAARLLFWPMLVFGFFLALIAVIVDGLSSFALGALISFQAAFGILAGSGRLKNWKPAKRIVSGVLWMAWIVVLGAYGRAQGWF